MQPIEWNKDLVWITTRIQVDLRNSEAWYKLDYSQKGNEARAFQSGVKKHEGLKLKFILQLSMYSTVIAPHR
jgi:hypothetical protein